MSRNSWITFGAVAIVIISMVLVALLILVPQSRPVSDGVINEYEKISDSEYSYTQSKDISEENMKETYSVTSEDINVGKSSKLYKQGNTDPFADVKGEASNNNSSANKNNNAITPYSAEDK